MEHVRRSDEMRPVKMTPDFTEMAAGSVLIECGRTRVLCTASVVESVPPFKKGTGCGWLTAEYDMLPGSTERRKERDGIKKDGRGVEIQRLIGRSLRAVVDLNELGENTASVDCDVIDADGGTRCAGITGAATALAIACRRGVAKGIFPENPFKESVAAISVGVIGGVPMLDLCYEEDSNAEVDMNVVMTESGKLVEVQGTAEGEPFSRARLNELIDLAEHGLKQVFAMQREAVETALEVRP